MANKAESGLQLPHALCPQQRNLLCPGHYLNEHLFTQHFLGVIIAPKVTTLTGTFLIFNTIRLFEHTIFAS